MILNKITRTCFFLALVCNSSFSQASLSKQMTLIGEVIWFDQTHVKIKSGNQEFIFSKEDLDHPRYIIGSQIEIPFNANKMNKAKVNRIKSGKNSKSPSV
jgi:hypothetical protein